MILFFLKYLFSADAKPGEAAKARTNKTLNDCLKTDFGDFYKKVLTLSSRGPGGGMGRGGVCFITIACPQYLCPMFIHSIFVGCLSTI